MAHVIREDLDRALPDVMAAPKTGAAIEMLCLRPAYNKRRFVDEISLTRDQGIPGERWLTRPWLTLPDGRPDPSIQVCVLSRRVLDLVWRDRDSTPHPGDTFIADMDLSEANLPEGQILNVGTARLRVSGEFNEGCVKWKARYGEDAWRWVREPDQHTLRLRGILCSVERDGVIRTGDLLEKI